MTSSCGGLLLCVVGRALGWLLDSICATDRNRLLQSSMVVSLSGSMWQRFGAAVSRKFPLTVTAWKQSQSAPTP